MVGPGKYKYIVKDYFRDYDSAAEGLADHCSFLITIKRYAPAFNTTTPQAFAQAVAAAGYATDPNYAGTLTSMIESVTSRWPKDVPMPAGDAKAITGGKPGGVEPAPAHAPAQNGTTPAQATAGTAPASGASAATAPVGAPAPAGATAPAGTTAPAGATAPATAGVAPVPITNSAPGGKDGFGTKENLLAPFYKQMAEVATELAPQFTSLGLQFRPEILLATAMQEAANREPLTNRSFDNGLGIMQITPFHGQLDPGVAKAINWDNSKDIETNIQQSNWRDAKSNLLAGAQTMLGKARSIKRGVPTVWEQMDEPHRWRAVLYAYNAGEGSAINVLRTGGPNAAMISTFTNPKGQVVSHDYTAEIQAKMDYVDGHDPFSGDPGKAGPTPEAPAPAGPTPQGPTPQAPAPAGPTPQQSSSPATSAPLGIKRSVGRGGANTSADVRAVQVQLQAHGIDPGSIDGKLGPHTISAIERFQLAFMARPDGLILPDNITAQHLWSEDRGAR